MRLEKLKDYAVVESWRPNGNQTTLAVDVNPNTNVHEVDAWLPVVGRDDWQKFAMDAWGKHGAATGGDPQAGWDQFHVDVPDTLPDGSQVDLSRLKAYGAAFTATDGASSDWLENQTVGGL